LRGNFVTSLAPLARLTALRTLDIAGNALPDDASLAALAGLEAQGLLILGKRAQLANYFATDFLRLCLDAGTSDAARKTIRAVLFNTSAEDCDVANERLLSLDSLRLADRALTDLTPLAGLPGLEGLDVSANLVTDVAPLASLERLRELDLTGDPIPDLSPLAGLVARGLVLRGP
jgi:Leucine-rich repeat (LRR) protein